MVVGFLGTRDLVIRADGKGYYDYLPAVFIYEDLSFQFLEEVQPGNYPYDTRSPEYIYKTKAGNFNKYFPGVTLLWLPFFLIAHVIALIGEQYSANGYSSPYQWAIASAAFFYLWVGLRFTRKLLQHYSVGFKSIFGWLIVLATGTPLLHYVHFDAAFTHIYSFALIALLFYAFTRLLAAKQYTLWAFSIPVLLGIITFVRPINLLVVVLLPLMPGSFNGFLGTLQRLVHQNAKFLLSGTLVAASILALQPLIWYLQTGSLLVWGYRGEGFEWLDPDPFKFLFSVRKGAFFYHPVLLLVLLSGLIGFAIHRQWSKLIYSLSAFMLIIYLLSSWHNWYYGAGYGSRPLIDYYPLFTILLVPAVAWWTRISRTWKVFLGIFIVMATVWNCIGTYQYQYFIQDWREMTWDKFKVIRWHMSEHYHGIWYTYVPDNYTSYTTAFVAPLKIKDRLNEEETVYSEPLYLDSVFSRHSIAHVEIEGSFICEEGSSMVSLIIDDPHGNNLFWVSQSVFSRTFNHPNSTVTHFYFNVPERLHGDKVLVSIKAKEPLELNNLMVKLIANEEPRSL